MLLTPICPFEVSGSMRAVGSGRPLSQCLGEMDGRGLLVPDLLTRGNWLLRDEISVVDDTIRFPIVFVDSAGNRHGTVHGGIIGAVVDHLAAVHLHSVEGAYQRVTASLKLSYTKPIHVGQRVILETSLPLLGNRSAVVAFRYFSPEGGRVCVDGELLKLKIGAKL